MVGRALANIRMYMNTLLAIKLTSPPMSVVPYTSLGE